jgi:hypothetical protein
MTLMQQLTSQTTDLIARGRLSRVVAKLFARVVKAETSGAAPFSWESMDINRLMLSVEDFLVGCENSDIQNEDDHTTCRSMARSLVEAVLNAKGGGSYGQELMQELHFDSNLSLLAALVSSCKEMTGNTNAEKSQVIDSMSSPTSKDVASLVSAIGSAQEGPDRRAAVDALRRYKAIYGDDELNAHLQEVSATFRKYVLEQLTEDLVTSKPLFENRGMSERLQHLRSKLNAAEVSVLSAVKTGTSAADDLEFPSQSSPSIASSLSESPTKSPSRNPPSAAAPVKLESLSNTTMSSVQSLRERLAAAQENRSGIGSGISAGTSLGATSTSSMGHAAALRARLEAVKRQNNPS